MKKLLSGILSVILVLSFCIPAMAAPSDVYENGVFQPRVAYELSLTDDERAAIHAEVDALAGDVGDAVTGDGSYDPLTLVGTMLDGSSYDSISGGSSGKTVPKAYPFPVDNVAGGNHRNEYDRKVAKLAWVVNVAKELGFPVVVQRQEDKVVYVEIGDPDAPEMVMALSHLDSPPASIAAGANLDRWVNSKGELDPTAYHTPYVKDGWIYGAGMQDDSGPTLATLYAAKAMMEAGVPMDRRVRIVMGIYEDNSPGVPSVADTLNYMDIPYYTANPGFYDNWAYKALNREETPIAAYTSDSRFPVIVGNSTSSTPAVSMNLSADAGKPFSLAAATGGVTLREGDPTLKDIIYGSTNQVISRAIFTLNVAGASEADRNSFIASVNAAATAQGWLPALPGTTPKVQTAIADDTIVLEINTGVAMEMPTPQYGKNAIVWGMYLLSEALPADLQLTKAAEGIADLFFQDGVEGEAYIGRYMDIPEELLRNLDNGAPNLTFAFGVVGSGGSAANSVSFYTAGTGNFSVTMHVRGMHINAADYNTAIDAVKGAFAEKGFTLGTIGAFSNPTLYLNHANPLTALQIASFKASMHHDPEAFSDVYGFVDMAFGQGTTGGTLASDFRNKMTAFGAIIPGNERWWHTANERMKVDSAVQMTKMMADGMQEMARYAGPAGAQYMWADIPGLNANRADLDLLDVTIGTYQDASDAVLPEYLGEGALLAATKFNIPMWRIRGNNGMSITDASYALGHEAGGVYLPLNDADFLANTFVLPMRLEFKYQRPDGMADADWDALVNGGFENFSFNILKDGNAVPLTLPEGADANKYFYKRISQYDPNTIYISANLAITDAPYDGVEAILADSKTDLYKLNAAYEAANGNPFPERGAVEQRGFFLFGDGAKDAEFTSPEAIYVALGSNPLPSNILRLKTEAHLVKVGDYFTLDADFSPEQSSNAAILTYTFDGDKFEYASFTPAEGTQVVNTEYEKGMAKITVVSMNYDLEALGQIMLRAKEDAQLKKEYQTVGLSVEFALKDEAGDKTIETASANASFTTTGPVDPVNPFIDGDTNGDGVVDLIDLSNMIDWFGFDDTYSDWTTQYVFFDFNNSKDIDIYDISYVAKLIQ